MSMFDDINNPVSLNQIGTALQAGGDILGAVSHYRFGAQAQQAAEFQAQQLRQNAGQVLASSQRQAFDVDRQSKYIASSALAAAAASGGGASDPTVVNLIARNAGEMAYQKAVALYQGADKARSLNMEASAKEFEGENVRSNSNQVALSQGFAAATTLIKGSEKTASLFQRFGGGGPGAQGGSRLSFSAGTPDMSTTG